MADSAHVFYWKNSIKLFNGFTLSGYSRAAENTGFYCRELEMAFDAGIQMNELPAFICLTHLHNDHVCNLNKMLIDNKKNPIIFIPDNDKFEYLLTEMLKFIYLSSKFIHPNSDIGKKSTSKYPYQIVKLKIGQSYQFKKTNNGSFYVEGLPSDHGVGSISFGIYETRHRCKPEFKNLQKEAYVNLKKDKIDFMESYKVPLLCFMSDTNHKPFSGIHADLIFAYKTVIIECTFLLDDDIRDAKKKDHIHWKNIEPIIRSHSEITFVLTHFSKKYLWTEVKHFFDKYQNQLSPLLNIIIWLHQPGPISYANLKATDNNLVMIEPNVILDTDNNKSISIETDVILDIDDNYSDMNETDIKQSKIHIPNTDDNVIDV